ncbi:DUF4166 domain-containing protein [Psychromarinibacter sp. S121]|uniref:DUF4166 domain-containing protein n=1 Tax=Psychromarinibacter sp. S121 TaxID=3415127 RepID=UPI003C7A9DA1
MADPIALACAARGIPLPPPLAAFHAGGAAWRGRAHIERGRRFPVPLLLGWGGFPPEAAEVPVTVEVRLTATGATWVRRFGTHVTRSDLRFLPERALVSERLGPFRLLMAPEPVAGGFALRIVGLSLWGLPAPRALHPKAAVREVAEGDMLSFDIGASLPLFGPLIRYRGTLSPQ